MNSDRNLQLQRLTWLRTAAGVDTARRRRLADHRPRDEATIHRSGPSPSPSPSRRESMAAFFARIFEGSFVRTTIQVRSRPLIVAMMLGPLLLASQTAAAQSCAAVEPYGDIGIVWRALPGNPLGCPLQAETGGTDGFGRSQRFMHGQVTWSAPQRGDHATLVAYQAGNSIELQWAGLEPNRYQFFIVRTDKNGANIAQQDVRGEPSGGWYVARNLTPGATYSFVVEGCVEVGVFGTGAKSRCRQGWLNRVSVTMAASPRKPGPTLPDPPGRGSSCWIKPDCVLDLANKAINVGGTVVKLFSGSAPKPS